MPEKLVAQEEFSEVVVTPVGNEVELETIEMYFESKKHSGGGPIKSCIQDGEQFIITFANKEGIFRQGLLHILQRVGKLRPMSQTCPSAFPQITSSPQAIFG